MKKSFVLMEIDRKMGLRTMRRFKGRSYYQEGGIANPKLVTQM